MAYQAFTIGGGAQALLRAPDGVANYQLGQVSDHCPSVQCCGPWGFVLEWPAPTRAAARDDAVRQTVNRAPWGSR